MSTVGTVSPNIKTILCDFCEPGFYQDQIGQFVCIPTPAGTFLPESGSNRPGNPCAPGRFSDEPSSIDCSPCEAGNVYSIQFTNSRVIIKKMIIYMKNNVLHYILYPNVITVSN